MAGDSRTPGRSVRSAQPSSLWNSPMSDRRLVGRLVGRHSLPSSHQLKGHGEKDDLVVKDIYIVSKQSTVTKRHWCVLPLKFPRLHHKSCPCVPQENAHMFKKKRSIQNISERVLIQHLSRLGLRQGRSECYQYEHMDMEAHNFLDKVSLSEFLAVLFEREWLPSGTKLSPNWSANCLNE